MAPSPTISFQESILLDICCALVVHAIYRKYEVDPANILATSLLLAVAPAIPSYFLIANLESRVLAILLAYGLFYVALVSSIVLYRISPFHPLAKYPGPISLKISKFVAMYRGLGGKQHIYFKKLHAKYGPYVRVGPNELSVIDADAIQPILRLRKGVLWTASYVPGTTPSIAALRDLDLHRERRKLWNRGFTSASLKEVQPSVESRVNELVDELSKRVSTASGEKDITVDLTRWAHNFVYDVMGDMVLGGAFSLMREYGDAENEYLTILEDSAKLIGALEHTPWVIALLNRFSTPPERQQRFENFVSKCYKMRKEQGSRRRDLFHYITNEDGPDNIKAPVDQVHNDLLIAIGAGADTTSTILAGIFFHLLSNPVVFDRLRREVDSVFPPGEGEPFDAVKLASMPYLNAIINETLRLQAPVPTSLQRSPLEGSGGIIIAGSFIPESTSVDVPTFVIHRDPRNFSPSPDSFIPERWLDSSSGKYTTNTSAFIPFAAGPGNCVGKNLALLEIRLAVATVVQKFDMKLADGYDPRQWEEDLSDYFVMQVGKLPAVLYTRK